MEEDICAMEQMDKHKNLKTQQCLTIEKKKHGTCYWKKLYYILKNSISMEFI